jgi:hypothetical protein
MFLCLHIMYTFTHVHIMYVHIMYVHIMHVHIMYAHIMYVRIFTKSVGHGNRDLTHTYI